ncbi:MAG: alpha-L-rhamnosidase C-terminal domain-containing protein, partial [Promethearchaeota archaeon]
TYFLFHALSKNNLDDVALQVIIAKGFPGYEYMINYKDPTLGKVTTMWESWSGKNSLCHPVQGCVSSWFFEVLGGITPTSDFPGFKKVNIQPRFLPSINWVSCELETIHGLYKVKWKVDAGNVILNVSIPVNTIASLSLPISSAGSIRENEKEIGDVPGVHSTKIQDNALIIKLGSGNFSFSFKLKPSEKSSEIK